MSRFRSSGRNTVRIVAATFLAALLGGVLVTGGRPAPFSTPEAAAVSAPQSEVRIALVRREIAAGRVSLEWSITSFGESAAVVERATPGMPWQEVGYATQEEDRLAFADPAAPPGARVGYRLVARALPVVTGPEIWVDVPQRP